MFLRNLVALFAVGLLVIAACSSSGSAPQPKVPPNPDATLVPGAYTVNLVDDTTSAYCEDDPRASTFGVTVAVSGNNVTITFPEGIGDVQFTNTGNALVPVSGFPFDYDEDGGTTTISYASFNVTKNNEMSGVSTWTWTDGTNNCNGTSYYTATGPTAGPAGN